MENGFDLFSLTGQQEELKALEVEKPKAKPAKKKGATAAADAKKKAKNGSVKKEVSLETIQKVFVKGQVNKDTVVMTQGSIDSIVLGDVFPECFDEKGELVEVIEEQKSKETKEETKGNAETLLDLEFPDENKLEEKDKESKKDSDDNESKKDEIKKKDETKEKVTMKIRLTPTMVRNELAKTSPQFRSKLMTSFTVDKKQNVLFALIQAGPKGGMN